MKRARLIREVPTTGKEFIEVELYYEMGGKNNFTGKERDRGYYLCVVPMRKSLSSGKLRAKSYKSFSGVVKKVKDVKRFSEKGFCSFIPKKVDIDYLVNYVADKNGLEILPEEAVKILQK